MPVQNNTIIQFPVIGKTTLSVKVNTQTTNLVLPGNSNKTTIASAIHGPVGPKGETGDSNWRTEDFTTDATILANKYVDLLVVPVVAYVSMVGGVNQFPLIDFSLTGNRLSWSGLDMEPLIDLGQKFVVHYRA